MKTTTRINLISKWLSAVIFSILLMVILFNIFGMCNADKKPDFAGNKTTVKKAHPISIDSLKNSGYTIFKSYDFFSNKGTELDTQKIKYPLLASRNNGSIYNLISVMSADSIVSRTITKNTKSLLTEKVMNFHYPNEVYQTTLVFVYRPEYIIAFDFTEDIIGK